MKAKQIIYIVLLSLFGLFILQNIASVTVNFLLWEIKLPRAILLLMTFFLGLGLGLLTPLQSWLKSK